jgi:hypothetical protein
MISKFIIKKRCSIFDVAAILLALSAIEHRAYFLVIAIGIIWLILGGAIECYSEA